MKEPCLHRQPNSPFYYAAFKIYSAEKGCWVRKFVSTKCREGEEVEAARQARKLQETALALYEGAIHGMSAQRAQQLVRDIATTAGLPLPSLQKSSWKQASSAWFNRQHGLSRKTAEKYQSILDSFTAHLGRQAEAPLPSILPSHLETWWRALVSKKTTATAKLFFARVKSVFQRALTEGLIQTNPAALVDLSAQAADDQHSREPFTADELSCILKAAATGRQLGGKEWVTLVLLGLCTGARLGDCLIMGGSHLTREEPGLLVLRYQPAKTARRKTIVEIPVVEPLASHLEELLPKVGDGPFCPILSKLPKTSNASDTFIHMLTRLRIGEVKVGKNGRKWRTKTFHSLRHTLPTWLLAAGVDEVTRMRIVGHASVKVSRRYSHSELAHLRLALNAGLSRLKAAAPPVAKRGTARPRKPGAAP